VRRKAEEKYQGMDGMGEGLGLTFVERRECSRTWNAFRDFRR